MSDQSLKIVITGASGKVAEAIIRLFVNETKYTLYLFSSAFEKKQITERIFHFPINYKDPKSFREQCLALLPNVIINTSAMTNVDACETEKQDAWNINVTWVEQIARTAAIIDAHLIHFSTDYVFDGKHGPYTELDKPNPISYYGKTKLAGENACKQFHGNTTIIRTNVVYGYSHKQNDFVQWLLQSLTAHKTVTIVNDQYSNPTFSDDIALSVKKVIEKKRTGIYNTGGADYCSRTEFAKQIANAFHLDTSLIQEIKTSELHQPAQRPLKGGLITLKSETDLGLHFSSIEQGLITLKHQMHVLPHKTGHLQ